MGSKIFGTDGIRGIANQYPIEPEFITKLSKVLVTKFMDDTSDRKKIMIGRDTRKSSRMIQNLMSGTFASMGVDVYLTGVLPTPAIAMLTPQFAMDLGVMITASHNPSKDNGIKIIKNNGMKLNEDDENKILKALEEGDIEYEHPVGDEVGSIEDFKEPNLVYQSSVRATLSGMKFEDMRIVLDCAHGAAFEVGPKIMNTLGVDLKIQGCRPDGYNINKLCGSMHPEVLKAKVEDTMADMGIALDGDGDRVIIIDESGEVLDGDQIIFVIIKYLKQTGKWNDQDGVILTEMSNMGTRKAFEKLGIQYDISPVGDRNVIQLMKEKGYTYGSEPSGHIILSEYTTSGDGLVAATNIMKVMKRLRKPLSALRKELKLFPSIVVNVDVKEKPPVDTLEALMDANKEILEVLGGEGRTFLRYSGTENKLRILVEGKNKYIVEEEANRLARIAKELIGA